MTTIRSILLDMHHQLITVDEAEKQIRKLTDYKITCTHESLRLVTDTSGRSWRICDHCDLAEETDFYLGPLINQEDK